MIIGLKAIKLEPSLGIQRKRAPGVIPPLLPPSRRQPNPPPNIHISIQILPLISPPKTILIS